MAHGRRHGHGPRRRLPAARKCGAHVARAAPDSDTPVFPVCPASSYDAGPGEGRVVPRRELTRSPPFTKHTSARARRIGAGLLLSPCRNRYSTAGRRRRRRRRRRRGRGRGRRGDTLSLPAAGPARCDDTALRTKDPASAALPGGQGTQTRPPPPGRNAQTWPRSRGEMGHGRW